MERTKHEVETAGDVLREGRVLAVHRSETHTMSKSTVPSITLLEGLGVGGDAHAGVTVQHLSRIARNPSQVNLRQVHLVHGELLVRLRTQGFAIEPGAMGENVTTDGIDLLALPTGARLHVGATGIVEITGLRNPCRQLNGVAAGLQGAVLDRDPDGELVRLAGVMGIVVAGGTIVAGDPITVELPEGPHAALRPV